MGNQQSTANEGCIEKPLECYQAMNERLVTQVREILHNRDYHDAQVVLEGQDRQPVIFGVNATVLALRSEYFKDKFFPTMEGNPQPPSAPRTVKLGSFMDPETFQVG